MLAVSSVLALALFVVVVTVGGLKARYADVVATRAVALGESVRLTTVTGLVQVVAAIALLVGVAAAKGTWQGWVNLIGAALVIVTVGLDVVKGLTKKTAFTAQAPALVVFAAAIAELVLRLV